METTTPTPTVPGTDSDTVRPIARWVVPALCVLWLAGKLWASRQQIRSSADATIALATAAAALPGVFQSVLLGALGAGLFGVTLVRSGGWRWVAGIGAGLVIGGATALLIHMTYAHLPSIGAMTVALLVGGALAGAAAAIPGAAGPLTAGAVATLGALVATTVLNSGSVLSRMLRAYGGDASAASFVHASKLVQYTDFTVVGIVAGIAAYWYLRRRQDRRFPTYLLAGATAGLVLLVAYGLTTVGGADLRNAAKALSDADRLLTDWESAESVPNAMIVLFVGAFVALIAFGRTLKPAAAIPAESPVEAPTDVAPVQRSAED